MILGIGVDTTKIGQIELLLGRLGSSFLTRTFSADEVEASKKAARKSEYLASRFAAKEAVFKAVDHLTNTKSFDFRIVETLNRKDGSPYIQVNNALQVILDEVKINSLLISLTTEGEYATAFVVAQRI